MIVHGSGTEQKCVEENEEEAGVRMGADGEYVLRGEPVEETCESSIPHLVRMEHSQSCDFVGSVTDGPALAMTTEQVSYKMYNVHALKVIAKSQYVHLQKIYNKE